MTRKEKKILISAVSFAMLLFLCYGAYPRQAVAAAAQTQRSCILVIDAGHGGEDGGAVSRSGIRESDINLAIALRTEQLSALLGIPPVMVRRSDVSIHDEGCGTILQRKNSDLRNRVKLVDGTQNAVLLSIHQNHFSESKYHGAQVFFADTPGSEALAESIQQDLRTYLDQGNGRQHKKSQKVFLMSHVSCPAVLVECGFLSNAAECEKLQQEAYQKKLAIAMLRSIVQMGNGVFAEREI